MEGKPSTETSMISTTSIGWTIEENKTVTPLVSNKDNNMTLLLFVNKQEQQDTEYVSPSLSHLSISLSEEGYTVREERGLEDIVKSFDNKESLLEYISKEL